MRAVLGSLKAEGVSVRRQSLRDWRSLWILLPLLLFAVHGDFSFENAGTSSHFVPRSSIFRNVIFPGIVYSIVLGCVITNRYGVVELARRSKLIVFLGILAIASAFWSQDPVRSLTFGGLYLLDTLFALYLVARFDIEEIIRAITATGWAVAILGIIMIVAFPQYAVTSGGWDAGAWQGIFIDRTSAAKCLVFLISPALLLRTRWTAVARVCYIAVLLLLILKAHAATADIILVCFVTFMAGLRMLSKCRGQVSVLILGVLCALVALSVVAGDAIMTTVLGIVGRDPTLTGRTQIWAAVMAAVVKRPILGYGYYAFWLGGRGESAVILRKAGWVFGYAHNGYLEIALQLGLVGVVVFLITLWQAIRNALICIRNRRTREVEWYIGIIVLTILYNLDEGTVVWPNELLSILYIVACCGLARAVCAIESPPLSMPRGETTG